MELRLSTFIVIKMFLQSLSGFWAILILSILLFSSSCANESNPSVEEQAQQIDKMLICPVCPAETIDQSQVPLALNMRGIVRDKLREGWTNRQILDYFSSEERYGPSVLSEPPKKGFTLTVWLVPPISFILACGLLGLSLKAMKKRRYVDRDNLQNKPFKSYLKIVDLEIRKRYLNDPNNDNDGSPVAYSSNPEGRSNGELNG